MLSDRSSRKAEKRMNRAIRRGEPILAVADPRMLAADPRLYPGSDPRGLYSASPDPRLYPGADPRSLYPGSPDPRLYPADPRLHSPTYPVVVLAGPQKRGGLIRSLLVSGVSQLMESGHKDKHKAPEQPQQQQQQWQQQWQDQPGASSSGQASQYYQGTREWQVPQETRQRWESEPMKHQEKQGKFEESESIPAWTNPPPAYYKPPSGPPNPNGF
ncbi:hypothetical protein C8J56DRAFT_945250 [Mycena floridula]|nr:hypothetical protein C8J56DRAFT_945250 [Mycena floridula]